MMPSVTKANRRSLARIEASVVHEGFALHNLQIRVPFLCHVPGTEEIGLVGSVFMRASSVWRKG